MRDASRDLERRRAFDLDRLDRAIASLYADGRRDGVAANADERLRFHRAVVAAVAEPSYPT